MSCPGKQRIFLVVCAKFFQIFDASDFTILCHVSSKSDETYNSGYFIDLDKIVICLVNGTNYIYQLPEKFVIFKFDLYRVLFYVITTPYPLSPSLLSHVKFNSNLNVFIIIIILKLYITVYSDMCF